MTPENLLSSSDAGTETHISDILVGFQGSVRRLGKGGVVGGYKIRYDHAKEGGEDPYIYMIIEEHAQKKDFGVAEGELYTLAEEYKLSVDQVQYDPGDEIDGRVKYSFTNPVSAEYKLTPNDDAIVS